MDDVRRIAGEMLDEIRTHPYEARVEAIAAEIDATRPDVVGVQEAAHLRVQAESDFSEDPTPNASTTVVDLLDLLASALDDRGLSPRRRDRDGHDGHRSPRCRRRRNDRRPPDRPDRPARPERSRDDRDPVRHLRQRARGIGSRARLSPSSAASLRSTCPSTAPTSPSPTPTSNPRTAIPGQIRPLNSATNSPTDRPVVLAGDLNSGPDGPTAAYDLLTESFADPLPTASPTTSPDLRRQASDLRKRNL